MLTQEQLSIINSTAKNKIVNASAGTGKTTILIEAASRVINKESKVAMFTLTNAAADEMKGRLKELPVFIGTIHSFALRELGRMEELAIFYPKIMSSREVRELMLQAYIRCYEVTRDYKDEVEKVLKVFNTSTNSDLKTRERQKAQRVISEYESLKKSKGLYDHNDGPRYLLEAMRQTGHKLDYTHLFVDEVQDITEDEFNLIMEFECPVLAIGDPRQNIFMFRNSFNSVFENFEKMGYNLFILTKNFRSKAEILISANSELEAVRGEGGIVETEGELLNYYPEAQILCRYNLEVDMLKPLFENVSTVHAFKGLEADNVVVIDYSINKEQDLEEEENIKFVARTRARNNMSLISLERALDIGRRMKYGY